MFTTIYYLPPTSRKSLETRLWLMFYFIKVVIRNNFNCETACKLTMNRQVQNKYGFEYGAHLQQCFQNWALSHTRFQPETFGTKFV